ncbi:bone morphogenetic protein 4-like [Glandiceps talaboti]
MEVRVPHLLLLVTFAMSVVRTYTCTGCEDTPESHIRHTRNNLKHERIRAIQLEILEKLGLKSKPNVSDVNITEIEKRRMLRVYQQSVQDVDTNQVHDLYPDDNFYAKRFYSFIDTGITPPKVDEEDWTDATTAQRFYFDLDIPSQPQSNHKVHAAKLKLYKERVQDIPNHLNGLIQVDVYLLLEPPREGKDTLKRVIDTKLISLFEPGWETFHIGQAAESWLSRPKHNYGIEISCNEENIKDYVTFAGGKNFQLENDIDEEEDHRPMLNLQVQEVPSLSRRRRYAHDDENCEKDDRCCRFPLKVTFKDIDWDDWIVAPESYEAFYCDGSCPHNHRPASVHALIKSHMNIFSRGASPKPCCTPKVLSALTLLHYDSTGKLSVTAFSDMVVDQCACS